MHQIAARPLSRLALALAVALALLAGSAALSGTQARAAVTASSSLPAGTLGDRVLNKAETAAGCWYAYAHAGPCGTGYDCSGLVTWAAAQLGISVPHSTYSMLAGTAHLYRVSLSSVRRGDLLFFGSGHVEFATIWYHQSFGAHHTGTRVGWRGWNSYYAPTMAMRFR